MGKKSEKKRLSKNSRQNKSVLVFDEEARKEWLTGFRKRKKERQQRAKDDLAILLKEEKTRQRDEFREKMKKQEAKYLHKLEDVEKILKEKTKAYECGGKTVEITEYDFSSEDMLGINQTSADSVGEEDVDDDTESHEEPSISHTSTKMPKKMSKVAVKIEKRLYKLNNKNKNKNKALMKDKLKAINPKDAHHQKGSFRKGGQKLKVKKQGRRK